MRHALFLPPFDGLADPDHLVEVAVRAEAAGWDGFFLWDHLLYAEPVQNILDAYVCLGAVAAATSTIALGPMVTPLIRRRPQVLARQALTVDRLSHGRLVLGLGIGDDGGPGGELSGFGEIVDAKTRGRALDEGLEVLTGLLSGATVRHDGEFYRAMDVTFSPTPARPGGIPIWLAARWPHRLPVRRAARYQGVVVIQMDGPSLVADLRRELEGAGADLAHFDIAVLRRDGDDPEAWAAAGVTWLLTRVGPYHLTYDDALAVAAAGPPRRRTAPEGNR
jgi:alkanesulfonate monooxygenase SsuD/methylene tetrahydromethanopterin reductase-like flavin-dependent oxidoreductase (luciferase family)